MKRDDKGNQRNSIIYKMLLDYRFRYQTSLDALTREMMSSDENETELNRGYCNQIESVLAEIDDVLDYLDQK